MSRSVHVYTAGDWDSSSLAFAVSRGPCTATPSASSQRSALPRHAVVPSRFRVQVRRVAPRSPPPEPRPPEGAIQRRVRRRTLSAYTARAVQLSGRVPQRPVREQARGPFPDLPQTCPRFHLAAFQSLVL